MAVSDSLPGVVIRITVNNQALPEYVDQHHTDDEHTVTRYIEAVSDQTFAVAITLLPTFQFKGDAVEFKVETDGVLVSRKLLQRQQIGYTFVTQGRVSGEDQIEKFQFAGLQTGTSVHAVNR